jgi:hypothetical protein
VGVIARAKNRDEVGWFVLGLLFSLPALIAVAAIPALPALPEGRPADQPAAAPPSAADKVMGAAGLLFPIGLGRVCET